jgi:hypothetical protein
MTLEGNAASVGGGDQGGLVVTPAAAPVQAAPLEPSPATYFERMQAAVAVADAAGEPSLDDQAAEVAASVSDTASVNGEENTEAASETSETSDQVQDETGEQPPEAQAPEAAKAPTIPYEQLPDNMRAELRKSNLAPEIKEALAQSWYERKAYHDVGFTVEQARQLKEVGFTPEVAGDRLRIHPTLEDAATDAHLANIARTIITDYQSNPSGMIEGLRQNAPEAFEGFADAFASELKTSAPAVYSKVASRAMLRALEILDSEYPAEDFETKEKIAFVKNKFFPASGEAPKSHGGFNPEDPIHVQYQKLQEQQRQQYAAAATGFERAVTDFGQQAVFTEVQRRVSEAMPKGVDQDVINRASGEIMDRVAKDFFGNRGMIESIGQMMRTSDMSQQALNNIVTQVYNRAVPLVAVHSKPVLEFWSKTARAPEQPRQPAVKAQPISSAGSRTVANTASAARVPAASPQPPTSTTPPKDFIAKGRSQGWDTGKIISAWLSGQR